MTRKLYQLITIGIRVEFVTKTIICIVYQLIYFPGLKHFSKSNISMSNFVSIELNLLGHY